MVESWAIIAVTAAILCGISGIVSKVALRRIPSSMLIYGSLFVITPISFIVLAYYWLAVGFDGIGWKYIILALATAVVANLGFFLYFDAMEKGPLAIVGSVSAAYPAIVVVGGIILLSETMTLLQAFGVVLTTAGVVTLVYLHGRSTEGVSCPRSALLLAVGAFFCWGAWGILLKETLQGMNIILYIGLTSLVIPPLTLLYMRLKSHGERFDFDWKAMLPISLAVIAIEVEQLSFYTETIAASEGPASLVFPIIASYPFIMIILAFAFLKERISLRETLLIFGIVTGILLVAIV